MIESQETELIGSLKLTSQILRYVTNYFQDQGFTQMLPVMLGRSTDPLGPDPNSSILKTIEVEYLGTTMRTMNSMILHKQVAVRDVGKIFILSPNIRLEKADRKSSGRHLFEFTQADFEIPYGKMKDVFQLMEKLLEGLTEHVDSEAVRKIDGEPFEFRGPFRVYSTHELEKRYGEDWEYKASMDHDQPFWATCHKREFYDREDEEKPGHYLNYDLIYPFGAGEGLSGAEREHDYQRIRSRMGRDKLAMDIYASYLEEAKKGFVPSAGGGFGVERLTRFLRGAAHIGDVQLFRRVPGETPGI
jgi:asparaginyl-tRNA synthetase